MTETTAASGAVTPAPPNQEDIDHIRTQVLRGTRLIDEALTRVRDTTNPQQRQALAAAATEQVRDAMNELLARTTALRSDAVLHLYELSRPAPNRRGNWRVVGEQIGCSSTVAFRLGKYGRAGGRR